MFRNCAVQIFNHILKLARKVTVFFLKWSNVFSGSKGLTYILPVWVLKFLQMIYEIVLFEQKIIHSLKKCNFLENKRCHPV